MRKHASTMTLGLATLAATQSALAHHAMGGEVPNTLMQGLLSGLAHPVIGIDHLAFIAAVGLASAFSPQRYRAPLAFVLATLAGCLMFLGGLSLPLAVTEIMVAVSVVAVGGMVLSGKAFSGRVYSAVFALAGLFHGSAYAATIVGAESTPLGAYLIGFAAIQYAIALATVWLVLSVWKARAPQALFPRLAGAVTAGVGAALLVGNIESVLFVV